MWKIGKIAGIDCSLHWTLLLLIAWTGFSAPAGGALAASLLISAVFGCVLLHELGHSMAARQVGIETSSIVLLPIGGIATLERMPRNPLHELWIAIAGPLVNVAIATALYVGMADLSAIMPGATGWFTYLLYANITLVVFNLLPAFPMDGGRVLRAALALRLPYVTATNIAASVGKVVAVALGVLAVMASQFMLLLVAIFVFFAGAAEARMVALEQASERWPLPIKKTVRYFANTTAFQNAREFSRPTEQAMQVIWDEREKRYRYAVSI